jgi:hypothetical protein
MASNREWQDRLRAIAEREGLQAVTFQRTAGNHLCVVGELHLKGGRRAKVRVVTSNGHSTGDVRTIRHYRCDLRRGIREARVFGAIPLSP